MMGNNGSHGNGGVTAAGNTPNVTTATNGTDVTKELVQKIAEKSEKFAEKQSTEMEHLRERMLKLECKLELMERMVQCLVQVLTVLGAGFMGVLCWLAVRSPPTVRIESSQLSGI